MNTDWFSLYIMDIKLAVLLLRTFQIWHPELLVLNLSQSTMDFNIIDQGEYDTWS